MKPILIILIYVLSLFSVQPTFALEWYEGGTLHKKNGADWNVAKKRDRMATSVDMIAKLFPKFTRKYLLGPDEYILKARVRELVICITEATEDHVADNVMVTDLAVLCIILLDFDKE